MDIYVDSGEKHDDIMEVASYFHETYPSELNWVLGNVVSLKWGEGRGAVTLPIKFIFYFTGSKVRGPRACEPKKLYIMCSH